MIQQLRTLFLIFTALMMASAVHAQINRPVSGVIAASTAPVEISFIDEQGDAIGRTANIGDPIYLNDEIITGPDDSLQVLLSDQTVFSIGPNSVLVFDEFIYDPAGSAENASLVASVKKGSFKFISGKVSKLNPGAMKLKMPNASASIRGTTVAGRVDDDGGASILLLSGAIDVFSPLTEGPTELLTPGWGTSISGGGIVAPATEFTPEQINDLVSAVEFISSATAAADGEGGASEGEGSGPALTPETAETIADVITLVTENVETDAEGSVSIANLASYLQTSGLAGQLGLSPEDLELEGLENINIEEGLINFLISGGQPLWLTVRTVDNQLVLGNPPPSGAQGYQQEQRALYFSSYEDFVSEVYAGSINFTRTGLALGTGTLLAGMADELGGGEQVFTSSYQGSGTVNYNVTLSYDDMNITGTVNINDLQLNGQNYGQVGGNINYNAFSDGQMLAGLELYTDNNLTAGGETASMAFTGEFGSITDGTNVLDGTIAGLRMSVNSVSNPEYVNVTDLMPDGTVGVAYLSEYGQPIHFDNSWTMNDDGTFTQNGMTVNLGQPIPTDTNGVALAVSMSTLNDPAQYTVVDDTTFSQVGTGNIVHLQNAEEIPALKAEQYTSGTVTQ